MKRLCSHSIMMKEPAVYGNGSLDISDRIDIWLNQLSIMK